MICQKAPTRFLTERTSHSWMRGSCVEIPSSLSCYRLTLDTLTGCPTIIRPASSMSPSVEASYLSTQTGRYDDTSVTSCGGNVPATTLPLTSSGLTLPSRTVALGHRSPSILIVAGCRLTIKLGASYSTRSTLRHPASRSASQTSWAVVSRKPLCRIGAKKAPIVLACNAADNVPSHSIGPWL